jgi:hypothetical protein
MLYFVLLGIKPYHSEKGLSSITLLNEDILQNQTLRFPVLGFTDELELLVYKYINHNRNKTVAND